MKKALSIVLCAMALVAMLSSSAFAVVKTVVLENNETAKNSAEVFGSWKIVRAYNSETSTRSLHVIPQYKNKDVSKYRIGFNSDIINSFQYRPIRHMRHMEHWGHSLFY